MDMKERFRIVKSQFGVYAIEKEWTFLYKSYWDKDTFPGDYSTLDNARRAIENYKAWGEVVEYIA